MPTRDVVRVITELGDLLRPRTSAIDCAEAAGRFVCDLFAGSTAAVNLMDYERLQYRTIVNVGDLGTELREQPESEYYPFGAFPFTTQRLLLGGAYRACLDDPDCPMEYRELLTVQGNHCCLGAPIRRQGRPLGELWVSRMRGPSFTEQDGDLAVACGATVARQLDRLPPLAA
jgi:hypothetical protein